MRYRRPDRRSLPRSLPIGARIYPTPPPPPQWLRKEDAPCCRAKALPDGRPVIGWCGPDCLRRLERDLHHHGDSR